MNIMIILIIILYFFRPVIQPSRGNDVSFNKQEIRLGFDRKGKSSSSGYSPRLKFGVAPNFHTELNKLRNSFELRKSDTFLDKLSDFFGPISRFMMNSWRK